MTAWTTFPESANEPPALGIWKRSDIEPECKSVPRSDAPRATKASAWEKREIRRLVEEGMPQRSISRRLALTEGAVRTALLTKGREA